MSGYSIIIGIVNKVLGQSPLIFYASYSLSGTSPFSFSTISMLNDASTTLVTSMDQLIGSNHPFSLMRLGLDIRDFYDAVGIVKFPHNNTILDKATESFHSAGMELELRDVIFKYPASRSEKPALSNITCKINPGSLVVVVANGSGKTSLIKLLTRLYEPSSGEILVDGKPATAYPVYQLRAKTAVLSQEQTLFKLSLAENIGLGCPSKVSDAAAIRAAAEKGGSLAYIVKQAKQGATVLQPYPTKGGRGFYEDSKLNRFFNDLEKPANVSGGERQRLVASRTFMRIDNGDIKLVIVDEPTAAMDPTAEYELFRRLRESREGKTMIFITHRFGHLTKHADLILCMSEGQLVESGTHAELLELGGEYHKLYNVQAQAFS